MPTYSANGELTEEQKSEALSPFHQLREAELILNKF